MSRKPNQSTLDAVALVGQMRENGKPHTPYSAAEAVGANSNAVYKFWNKYFSKPVENDFDLEHRD